MMNSYTTNWALDALVNTKKYYVDAFVKNKDIAAPLHSFIDAQASFAKVALKSVDSLTQAIGSALGTATNKKEDV